ncbi:MAG: hypothetical protein O2794_03410 [bacterium]|nr:hypothetical protein [bacterium]
MKVFVVAIAVVSALSLFACSVSKSSPVSVSSSSSSSEMSGYDKCVRDGGVVDDDWSCTLNGVTYFNN